MLFSAYFIIYIERIVDQNRDVDMVTSSISNLHECGRGATTERVPHKSM